MAIKQYLILYGPYAWELALAVIFTVIGMVFSQKQLGKRERKRVLDELTNIQREMHRRANRDWTADNATREVWMISLYFERVRTLKDMMGDREKMSVDLVQLFESYENSLRNFARVWADAERRQRRFWEAYFTSYEIYHQIIQSISREYVIANRPVLDMLKKQN